jgi:hypothetical protein
LHPPAGCIQSLIQLPRRDIVCIPANGGNSIHRSNFILQPEIHRMSSPPPPPTSRAAPGKEWTMPFIQLEDHDEKGSIEYHIRPELIREVDIFRDGQGKICKLDLYLMDGNYQIREDSAFEFKDEAADAAFNTLRPFLTAT